MNQPGYPVALPPKPPVARSDLWISIAVLVATAGLGAVASVLGLLSLAFLDYCPPESCSADGAVTAVGTTLIVAFVIGALGLVATIVQLARRRPAWPFAVSTLVLCMLALGGGVVGYGVAVG
jgi:hypothetical protein